MLFYSKIREFKEKAPFLVEHLLKSDKRLCEIICLTSLLAVHKFNETFNPFIDHVVV
jgi:hypothetical protein